MATLRTAIFALVFLLISATGTHSLAVTPNSPCKSKCASGSNGTLEDNIVCLDTDFTSTTTGSQFQQCVECELGSSAADPKTGTTDVMWGLYNMRYTLSSCMFGFPTQKVSLSSPCQVSCTPLSNAIESGLGLNATIADLGFCNTANFTSSNIQRCVFCYGLMDGQKYLANFLQALDVACQDPPSPTNPFPVAASSIFNETTIQPPTTSAATSSGSSHLHGTPLILAIVLPIVFFFLILTLTCIACFFSARRRRREMAARGKMRRVQEPWQDSPATPRATKFDWEQATIDMEHMKGAHVSQRLSHVQPFTYRDDVGPGTGQIQDHSLHDQYFAPSPKPQVPFPADEDETDMKTADDLPHERPEIPNLLHSPVQTHAHSGFQVAHCQPETLGDNKDKKEHWI